MKNKRESGILTGYRGKADLWELAVLGVCIGFYMIFPLLDGPVWCVDSHEYVAMGITREPLYPSFLALCRGIAKVLKVDALMTAVVLQSLFAGIAAWYAGYTVRHVKNDSRILQMAAVFFQFAMTLLTSFLLISLRKQMMITLLIAGGVFLWYVLLKERRAGRFLCLCIMLAGVFLAGGLLTGLIII